MLYLEHAVKAAGFGILAHGAFDRSGLGSEDPTSLLYCVGAFFMAYCCAMEVYWSIRRISLPPGSLGIPILGEMPNIAVLGLMDFLIQKAERYKDVFLTHILFKPQVAVVSDESMMWLLKQERQESIKQNWPSHVKALVGPAAVTNQDGAYHKALRRWMDPVFTMDAIQSYFKGVDNVVKKHLASFASTGDFINNKALKKLALSLLVTSVFNREDEKELELLDGLLSTWFGGFVGMLQVESLPWTNYAKAHKARRELVDIMLGWINEFRNDKSIQNKEHLLLGRLLSSKREDGTSFSTTDLTDNLVNILFAGHDTTYATVSTMLYLLNEHQDVWHALCKEVRGFPSDMEYQTLQKAPVVNAVLDETFRVHPSVYGSNRKAAKSLRFKDYTIPPGFELTYAVAPEGQLCPSPREFHIERFLPADHEFVKKSKWMASVANGIKLGPTKFRPFGGGVHMCMGMQFARMEARVILARLAQSYDLEIRNAKHQFIPFELWSHEFKLTPRS